MQISFKKIFYIIILSWTAGLIVNGLSSRGLPLLYEKKEIAWGNDSTVTKMLADRTIDLEKPAEVSGGENSKKNDDREAGEPRDNEPILENNSDETSEPVKIDLKTAYKLFNKNVLFIDARPPEEFSEGHIQGAYSIPYYSDNVDQLLNQIKKDQPVVVYCSGTDCDLSVMLGNKMSGLGYKKIFVFFGGWNDWLNNKYPVEGNEVSE